MLYNNEHKTVYLAPPKTATRSMFNILLNRYDFKRYKAPHFDTVPEQFKDYTQLITVRNPYDRVVSLWWYFFKNKIKPRQRFWFLNELKEDVSLLDFLEYIKENQKVRKAGFRYLQTQKFYFDLNKVDKILHVGNLESEFKTLQFYKETERSFPVVNASKNKDNNYMKYIDRKSLKLINEIYKEDFELLKYKLLTK